MKGIHHGLAWGVVLEQLNYPILKREHEDYTCRGIIGNLKTIPFREFQFYLVPLIPYPAIAKVPKKILVSSFSFLIFTRVETQTLKQRLKQNVFAKEL